MGNLPREIKRPEREGDHTAPCSTKRQSEYACSLWLCTRADANSFTDSVTAAYDTTRPPRRQSLEVFGFIGYRILNVFFFVKISPSVYKKEEQEMKMF